jgi:hypothetical protein
MSAQSTIAKLREENAVMAMLLKRANGERLSGEEEELLAELRKQRALEESLRDKHDLDLSGVIEKALRNPATTYDNPAHAELEAIEKAEGDTLAGAIAKAVKTAKVPGKRGRAADLGHALDVLDKAREKLLTEQTEKANAPPSAVNWKYGRPEEG